MIEAQAGAAVTVETVAVVAVVAIVAVVAAVEVEEDLGTRALCTATDSLCSPAIALSEEFCMDINSQLQHLMNNPDAPTIVFPSTLDNTERRYIHSMAKKYALFSKSKGSGDDRRIHVSRAKTTANMEVVSLRTAATPLHVSPATVAEIDVVLAMEAPEPNEAALAMPPPFRPERRAFAKTLPAPPPPHTYSAAQRALPAHQHRAEIVDLVAQHQVVVVAGDTGCGKSTQLPQFLLDAPGPPRRIVVTQPRRISALTLAERVCEERGLQVGREVGYCIRLDSRYSAAATQLVFATTGTMLRWLSRDPTGAQFTHIVVDEVHERDKDTDFLLVVLKLLLPLRPDLRVVLMSATIQLDKFAAYFGRCPVLRIHGRTHPVHACFLDDVLLLLNDAPARPRKKPAPALTCVMCGRRGFADAAALGAHVATCFGATEWAAPEPPDAGALATDDIANATHAEEDVPLAGSVCERVAARLAARQAAVEPGVVDGWVAEYQLTQDALDSDGGVDVGLVVRLLDHLLSAAYGDGAILVFLPGWDDIQDVADALAALPAARRCVVAVLHSRLSPQEQKRAFTRPPRGQRKVVLATNIAETSVTIEDVVYVVDTAKSKQSKLINGYSALHTEWASVANCTQRRGRAGRVAPGVCFHLLSRARFSALPAFLTPELLTTALEPAVLSLQLLQWQAGDTLGFESVGEFLGLAPDPPLPHVVASAVAALQALGALNADESLTQLGWELAQVSLPPAEARALLLATCHGVAAPVLFAACALGHRDPFDTAAGPLRPRKVALADGAASDHWTLYRAIAGYLLAGDRRAAFCRAHGLVQPTLFHIAAVIKQVELEYVGLGYALQPPAAPPSLPVAQAVLAAGLYPNLMYRDAGGANYTTKDKHKVRLAGSSVVATKARGREWVAFHDMMQFEHGRSAHVGTTVAPLALALFVGHGAEIEERVVDEEAPDEEDPELVDVVIDRWIVLAMARPVAARVLRLRRRLHLAFLNYVQGKGHAALAPADVALLEAVAKWLAA
ncbi:DEAD/DEAH box RNA helicase [Achlya hypogyna]|uniref:DEAD/DEAH box RNA helicase n=1 Tax=Achlya hypogyna TaxID=1202772 RepID=A0A1V9YR62_ACHHY|nr:DEAD/DEAH box RNA helicase [Achlya hypogyna]